MEGALRFDSVNPNRDIADGKESDRVALGINERVGFKFEHEVENDLGEADV